MSLAAGQTTTTTPSWVIPVIAAVSAILAALVTGLTAAYTAKRKVAEIELNNTFELAKQYLDSARNYTQTVYLPLAVAVYKLQNSFLTFKTDTAGTQVPDTAGTQAPDTAGTQAQALSNTFAGECTGFIAVAEDLFNRGAAAVFTLRLDETLTRFVTFLRESLTAEQKKVINDLSLEANIGIFGWRVKASAASQNYTPGFDERYSSFSPQAVLSLRIPFMGFQVRTRSSIAAAPLSSKDFERQFTIYIKIIKAGIKEVTLGGYKESAR